MLTTTPVTDQTAARLSFAAFLVILCGVIYFGLGTPFITILFGYLTLHYLGKQLRKPFAILAFGVLVFILFYLFAHFMREAVRALPLAASKAIPTIVNFADQYGFNAPFDDPEGLKSYALQSLNSQLHFLARFAQFFTKEFVYVIIALVATCGIFASGRVDLGTDSYTIRNNLYSVFAQKLTARFGHFFQSFHTVMGAQVVKCKAQMRIIAFIQDEHSIKDIMKSQGIPDFQAPPPIPKFIDAEQAIDELPSYDSFEPTPDDF